MSTGDSEGVRAAAPTVLLFANTDWYLWNFRLPLARALREAGYTVHLASPAGEYARRIEDEGFRWHGFDFARQGMNPLAEALTVFRLVRLYRGVRPAVAHHFTIKCVLYGSLAARAAGTPRVINAITGLGHVFVSGGGVLGIVRRLILGLYRLCLAGTDVIFQNGDDRAAFEQAGLLRRSRVHLIRGSGVDVERFRPDPQRRYDRRPVVIFFASRLLREKGVFELIEAAGELARRGVDARIRVAGAPDPGNPSAVDASTLAQWAKLPNVEFLGHREDIAQLLQDSDIVVLPSYREGTPRILLEAAACGLPLVATDVPGCREVVRADDNGILVPAGDGQALANALISLADDAESRARMGARSRVLACEEFAQSKVLAATLAIYPPVAQGVT